MGDLLSWLIANADTVGLALAGIHGLAVAVVNLTPTPADNIALGKLYRVIEALAGILTKTAKAPPGAHYK